MSNEPTFAITFLSIFLFVYLAILGISLTDYILSSLALQKIGSRRKVKNSWLVWLPFAHNWALGALADEYDSHINIKRKWRVTLLTLSCCGVAMYILMFFVMFAQVFSLAFQYGDSSLPTSETVSVFLTLYILFFAVLFVLAIFGALYNICFFKIFESVVPQKAVLYFVLSLLVPLARGICLFKSRNLGYSIEYREVQPQSIPLIETAEQE